MLRNYFKMAIKVLLRNKFYTFISMFGISLALAILLIVSSFWEHTIGPQSPEVNLDRSLVVWKMTLKNKGGGNYLSALASHYFLDKYVRNLKSPEEMTFFTPSAEISTFLEDKKLKLERKFTDAHFWNVMKFDFTEGSGYTEDQVKFSEPVAVISRSLKEQIFGFEPAVGKELEIEQEKYQVIGVIEDVSFGRMLSSGDLYLPLSLDKGYRKDKSYVGGYLALLVAHSPAARQEMQQEYAAMMDQVENPDPQNISNIVSNADPFLTLIARAEFGNEQDSGLSIFYAVLAIISFLFILLPTVNLININISRTMERASEIGARKAFGASSLVLVFQFLVENLILTFLCGIIALLIAFALIEVINSAEVIRNINLTINYEVFMTGLIVTIAFGLLSGVYPAWRMSRMQPAEALKEK